MGTNGDANAAGVAACTGIPMCRIEGTRLSTKLDLTFKKNKVVNGSFQCVSDVDEDLCRYIDLVRILQHVHKLP